MPSPVTGIRIVLTPMPPTHFGAVAIDAAAGVVRDTGSTTAVIVTDHGLAGTAVVASVAAYPRTCQGRPASAGAEDDER
jgi:hypothetical protein